MLWLSGYDNSNLKRLQSDITYQSIYHIEISFGVLYQLAFNDVIVHQRLIKLFHIDHLCNPKSSEYLLVFAHTFTQRCLQVYLKVKNGNYSH